jgi:hypothetical protein
MGCALYIRCALSKHQKECRKSLGCALYIGVHYLPGNTVISIQPLGRFWQEPEPSQVTRMARCILGKFLGVVCHCFPLPLDVPTFAARCLHVPNNVSAPSSKRWNCGREWCPVILPKWRLFYAI